MCLFLKRSLPSAKMCLLIIVLLVSTKSFAQPVVTLSKVNPACPADGEITVNATNTTGTVLYMLAAPSPIETTPQTSNHFSGLPPGEYTVHVYDNVANETPVSATITLTSTYKTFRVISVNSSSSVTASCVDDGYITISAADGKTPYTYEIESGPVTRPPQSVNNFKNLPTGLYTVRVKDACGASISAQVNVSSLYNLAGRDIVSISTNLSTSYNECDNTFSISTWASNFTMRDQNNAIISYSSNSGLEYRVEYPAGSGQYSSWMSANNTANITGAISDEQKAGITYGRVQVKHPCTGVVTTSSNISVPKYTPKTLNVIKQVVFDICVSYPQLYLSNGTSICSPNKVVIEEVGNPTNSITFLNFSSSYIYNTNDPSVSSSTTYKFGFEWDKSYKVTYYNSVDVEVNSIIFAMGSMVTKDPVVTSYLTHYDCRYDRYDMRWSIPGNLLSKQVTITIVNGPSHAGEVFTSTGSSGTLGSIKDFAPGDYLLKFDFANGCPSIEHEHTITQSTSGGRLEYIKYEVGNFCGNYNLKVKWTYLDMQGNPIFYPPLVRDNDYRLYVDGFYIGYADSNAERIATNLSSGPHHIEIYPWDANKGSFLQCKVVDTTIIIPDYSLPIFNIAQSGGAVCSGSKGNIHVEVTGLTPFQYQIKRKGEPDSSYSPLQSSPDFVNLDPGSYIVRVRDGCGNEMPQEVMLISTAGGSAINAIGANADNKVCLGSPVTIMLKPVGPVSSVTWTKPDGTTTNNMFIVIPSFAASDAGTYHVEINSAAGCTISSSLDVELAPEVNLAITHPAPGVVVDITNAAVVAGSTPSGLTYEYYTDAVCTNALATPSAITTSGTYYIKATSTDGCTAIAPVNVTILRNLIMSVVGSSSISEGETATIKIATEGNVNAISNIVINLTYTSSTTTIPNVTFAPVTVATSVTIPAGQSSVTFNITANNDLLLEGVEVITVTAVAVGDISMKPGADVVSINVADLTNGAIVVETVKDAVEVSTSGVFRISFSEPGVTSTRPVRVDVEISGSANSGSDFTPMASSYIIPRLTHSVDINVNPIENYVVEGNSRAVSIRLINASIQ